MADRNERLQVVAAFLALLCALAACSEGRTSDDGASPRSATLDCRPTRGEPAQGSAAASAGAPSSVKLGPGSAITPEEAAAEAPGRRGRPLILTGTVYAADCRTPLPGALIEVWQTDARGRYGPGHGTDNLRCCYLQGTVETDSSGGYEIQTIPPGHYRGDEPPPPAHIHFNVHYRGTPGVLTEVVFAGDPYLTSAEPGAEVISLRKEAGSDGGRLLGRFDIVLSGKG